VLFSDCCLILFLSACDCRIIERGQSRDCIFISYLQWSTAASACLSIRTRFIRFLGSALHDQSHQRAFQYYRRFRFV